MFFLRLIPQATHFLVPDLLPLSTHQPHVHVLPTQGGDDVNEHGKQTITLWGKRSGVPLPPPGHQLKK